MRIGAERRPAPAYQAATDTIRKPGHVHGQTRVWGADACRSGNPAVV